MTSRREKGFTLVEIAIVLVVIGLLLGGILKGQQLINSARVRNLADQNSGVQAAYYGFIDRFRNVPGDMLSANACQQVGTAVDPTDCPGTPANAPGGISGTNGGNGQIDTIREAGAVWAHLSAAGFLNGTFAGFTSTTAPTAAQYRAGVSTGDVPPNAFQGPILLAHMNDYLDSAAQASVTRLAYSFGGLIPVPILRDLDAKIDDGVAGTGVLRSAWSGAGADGTFGPIVEYTPGSDDCLNTTPTPNIWDVDSSNQTCNAIFLY